MIKKKLLIGLVLCMTLSLTEMTTVADTIISGGALTASPAIVGEFTTVALNGTVQTTAATFADTTIVDATGNGIGWNVKIDATQLTNLSAPVDHTTLPLGSLSIVTPTVIAGTGSSADSPTNIVKASGNIDGGAGVKVLSAIANEGMGTYTANYAGNALTLTLNPKDVYEGTYTTTITTTITTTP